MPGAVSIYFIRSNDPLNASVSCHLPGVLGYAVLKHPICPINMSYVLSHIANRAREEFAKRDGERPVVRWTFVPSKFVVSSTSSDAVATLIFKPAAWH